MIQKYDLNKLEIGMISFNQFQKVDNMLKFENFEVDCLAIDLNTGLIELLEENSLKRVYVFCLE